MSQDPILFHAPSGRWTSTNGQAAVAKRAKRGRAPITLGPILHERCRSRAILTRSNECMSTVPYGSFHPRFLPRFLLA